jgi:hypothetical protein
MTFFVVVRPHGEEPFYGALHLSGSSLANLESCPRATRTVKSLLVTGAFHRLGC